MGERWTSIYALSKVFYYVTQKSNKPHIKVIMLGTKFNGFDNMIKDKIAKKAKIIFVNIQNPNNPAQWQQAVLIDYEFTI